MLIYLQLIDSPEDQSKFEKIYYQYRGLMLYVARHLLNRYEDAEDAVHEAFIKIAKNISRIGDFNCPKTRAYIVIIVENTCIDLLRKNNKHPVQPLDFEPGIHVDYAGENELTRCILQLPAQDRDILLLRFDLGYSSKEAAKLLGISEAAARKREQRAKDRLHKLCKEAELL